MHLILADDQTNVRFALRTLLNRQPDIEVLGEAADSTELMNAIKTLHPEIIPDIILLDWGLPGLPTEKLISAMRDLCPDLVVIVLSGRLEVNRAARAAGANRFVSKADPPGDLLEAIRTEVSGAIPARLE